MGRLAEAKAKLISNGAIARLAGVEVGEEIFSLTIANPSYYRIGCTLPAPSTAGCLYPSLAPSATVGNSVAHGDAIRSLLTARLAEVRAAFPAAAYPNVYTIQVEHLWNDDPGVGPYVPPPANLDVLGMDPYMEDQYLSVCDASTKAHFDATAGIRVYWARQRWGQKPILLVAQAFRHGSASPGHTVIPAACQMEWWYQLAMQYNVPALVWFAYGYDDTYNLPGGNAVMGVRYPAHVSQWTKMIEIFDRNLANRP